MVNAPYGPIETTARATDLEDGKRRHVLIVLAGLLDKRPDPSIREIARAARRHRMEVCLVLDKLTREGHLEIAQRGDGSKRTRTTYSIPANTATSAKGNTVSKTATPTPKGPNTMTTKTTTTKPLLAEEPTSQRVPRWQRSGYLPGPCQRISWPALDAARERHESAVEALSAAREAGDAEAEALIEVADAVLAADTELRATVDEAEAAFLKLASEVHPPGLIKDGAANAARIAELRPALEADQKIVRRVVLGVLDADCFLDERGTTLYPSAVAEAMRLREAIK
jgi:hypothetical protein